MTKMILYECAWHFENYVIIYIADGVSGRNFVGFFLSRFLHSHSALRGVAFYVVKGGNVQCRIAE